MKIMLGSEVIDKQGQDHEGKGLVFVLVTEGMM